VTPEQRRRLERAAKQLNPRRPDPRTPRQLVDLLARRAATPSEVEAIARAVADDLERELVIRGLILRHQRRDDLDLSYAWEPISYAAAIASHYPDEEVVEGPVSYLELHTRFEPENWRRTRHNPERAFRRRYDAWVRARLVMAVTEENAECLRLRAGVEIIDRLPIPAQLSLESEIARPPSALSRQLVAPLNSMTDDPDVFMLLEQLQDRLG
jgi:hypothetical protein